jgi:hypothetical protein
MLNKIVTFIQEWFAFALFVVAIGLVLLANMWENNLRRQEQQRKYQVQVSCQRACDPYRVVACVEETRITRAVCFSDDPYIANMIVVGDDMNRLEYWRDHCGGEQDQRIPVNKE